MCFYFYLEPLALFTRTDIFLKLNYIFSQSPQRQHSGTSRFETKLENLFLIRQSGVVLITREYNRKVLVFNTGRRKLFVIFFSFLKN